jgi:hypothetical protein
VYGIIPQQTGTISISYTVDDGSSFQKVHSYNGVPPAIDLFNYVLLDTGPLAPGNHTVNLTLDGIIGQTLIVDYITYVPAFSTLAAMPVFPPPPSPSSSGQKPLESHPPAPLPRRKSPVGPIAGGVVGALAVLALVVLALLLLRRRRRKLIRKTEMLEDCKTDLFSLQVL